MGTTPSVVLVSDLVGILESLGHVVGVEQSDSRNVRETISSEHLHVRPGNGQD